jgi:hypothetical protein
MTIDDYYKAPPQKVFDEIKAAAIEIWEGYDNEHGYATDKINRIRDIQNIQDNAWYMVAMFDHVNQAKLINMVSEETAAMIRDARGY